MKLILGRAAREAERGAALLLSLLILLVLVAIVIQINVSTGTDARIGRNDVTITTMDLAAESALLQMAESLKTDAEGDQSSASEGGPQGGAAGAGATGGLPTGGSSAGAPAAQQPAQPVDSRRDEWATPQRTEINGIQMRIVTQDENSKYNVLNLLNPDEKEAEAAFDRVVRILDACREGTGYDIDARTAEEMAKTIREHLTKRRQSSLPRPKLLTDDEKNEDLGLPLTMREFMPLEPFEELHFKDFRDADGEVVHSITSFLTVWSSLSPNPMPAPAKPGSPSASNAASKGSSASGSGSSGSSGSTSKSGSGSSSTASTTSKAGGTGSTTAQAGSTAGGAQAGGTSGTGASGTDTSGSNGTNSTSDSGGSAASAKPSATTGGYSVNVNTAPAAVLKSLFDGREVPGRFWDKVIEYRNLEDEEEKEKAKEQSASEVEEEQQVDEYGQPILKRRIFSSLSDLSKVDGWSDLPTEYQSKLMQLLTVQSEVFSVFVVARKSTSAEDQTALGLTPAEMRKREETRGDALQRVVHSVLWRQKVGGEVRIAPVIRWEILDYLPYEVLDFPPEDR